MISSRKKGGLLAVLATVCLFCGVFLIFQIVNNASINQASSVSADSCFSETDSASNEFSTPYRKGNSVLLDSVKNKERLRKNEQRFHNLEIYTTFNIANKKPIFKVGPGSVKKLYTEKPEQSNPFNTEVEPSSSDRLPFLSVDDESVPAIFFSAQIQNDCESQSVFDTLPEIDLLSGKLIISPLIDADSSRVEKP